MKMWKKPSSTEKRLTHTRTYNEKRQIKEKMEITNWTNNNSN